MIRDYLAYVWGRVPGMAAPVLQDIYAAKNMACLTSMILGRGLKDGEFVRYHRQWLEL
jgi:hypothetical protein